MSTRQDDCRRVMRAERSKQRKLEKVSRRTTPLPDDAVGDRDAVAPRNNPSQTGSVPAGPQGDAVAPRNNPSQTGSVPAGFFDNPRSDAAAPKKKKARSGKGASKSGGAKDGRSADDLLDDFFADVTSEVAPSSEAAVPPVIDISDTEREGSGEQNKKGADPKTTAAQDRDVGAREVEQAAYEARFARSLLRWCGKRARGKKSEGAPIESTEGSAAAGDSVAYSLGPDDDVDGGVPILDLVMRKRMKPGVVEKKVSERPEESEDEDDDSLLLDWRGR